MGRASLASTPRRAARRAAPERPDRQQAILLAAERLFAQQSYHAVTIRQIAEEAGVPLALVGYYYGQKHELFEAVFERWAGTIAERLAALHAVPIVPGDAGTLHAIVEAFVMPVARLRASAEGEHYARLVAQQLHQGERESEAVLHKQFDPMARAFIDTLQQAMPWAQRADLAWGYQFALGALLHHLTDTRVERLSNGAARAADAAVAPRLVDFIAGGLRAMLPAPPSRSVRSRPTPRRQTP